MTAKPRARADRCDVDRREIESLRRENAGLKATLRAAEAANVALRGLVEEALRRIPTPAAGQDAGRQKPGGPP
jgi:hypothetical protein